VGPAEGRLACGAEGPGRLASTDEILQEVKAVLKKGK
jgi:phosphopantothenoylcysteine synthetase/decarboxylase